MIELVRGSLLRKMPTFCVIDTAGVGIGVHISLQTFQKLGSEKEQVELLTYLHVREDALQLFGFLEEEERNTFKKLINVSGIGPRLALSILSGLTVEEFRQAVAREDHDRLTKIPGVGRKTAQRVVLELKEKISGMVLPVAITGGPRKSLLDEAILALLALGYRPPEARTAIESVLKKHGKDITLEDLIKFALQEI